MGRTRKALKFTAAGALTTVYGLAGYKLISGQQEATPLSARKAAVTVGALISMTWLATLL